MNDLTNKFYRYKRKLFGWPEWKIETVHATMRIQKECMSRFKLPHECGSTRRCFSCIHNVSLNTAEYNDKVGHVAMLGKDIVKIFRTMNKKVPKHFKEAAEPEEEEEMSDTASFHCKMLEGTFFSS